MSYYLTLEYANHYWEYLDSLLKLKLYMNRYTLHNLVAEFYEELFDKIEEKNALPWVFDYIEYKSEAMFKHVSFEWYDHGEMIQCHYDFGEVAVDFLNYEYFLDPRSGNTTADNIATNLCDDAFIMCLDHTHVDRRNENFHYGDDIEYQKPFLMEVNLVNIVHELKEIDDLISRGMFIFKHITTPCHRFTNDELFYTTKLNHSFCRGVFFCRGYSNLIYCNLHKYSDVTFKTK